MISMVFPAFNERENLGQLHRELCEVSEKLPDCDFEFVFVDDGSTDSTHELLMKLRERDARIKVIRLLGNWGSHSAIVAGLDYCDGHCAIVLSADLQDPPQIIPQLLGEWKRGAKIVWGTRLKREGESVFTVFFSRLYYFLMKWLTSKQISALGADVFLADREVIEEFRKIDSRHQSVFMTMARLPFRQASVGYVKRTRFAGKSKWTLRKKIKLVRDSVFSNLPLLNELRKLLGWTSKKPCYVIASITDGRKDTDEAAYPKVAYPQGPHP